MVSQWLSPTLRKMKTIVKQFFKMFKVKREEVVPSLVALVMFVALNALVVSKYFGQFCHIGPKETKLFYSQFGMSGFDPITYSVLTNWWTTYNVYRHPLLAYFAYPFYGLNQGFTALTGMNLAQIVVALVLVTVAYYSFIFIYRIVRELVGLDRFDATLLAFFMFSMAYVLISIAVPDHFGLSMMLLLMALYISGKCIQRGRRLNIWQTWLLFVFTAGTTLSNGIKIFIDALFVNGRKFFRIKYLLAAVLLPSLLVWAFARWEYATYVGPHTYAEKQKKVRKGEEERQKLLVQFKDTTLIKDSVAMMKTFNRQMQRLKHQRWLANQKQPWVQHKGRPMGKGEFEQWTDISTSRWQSAVENIFGESMQLHERYLLGDTLRGRPVIVSYRSWLPYVAEGLLVALFVAGVWCGRRSRFFWMCLSGMFFDAFIHVVLGFGLNEAYIMTAHWAFVIPIAMAYLLRQGGRFKPLLRTVILLLTVWLYAWNWWLLVGYLTA